VLHEGGQITIDRRGITEKLLRGLEYKALATITSGMHNFLGELMELCYTARLIDVHDTPVMDEPRRPQ
jgi:hypothetical protein